ncbi:MAG: MFS transporter [Mycoplasma sp.]|nr:MFS transporter [Mycoplasma sp.]
MVANNIRQTESTNDLWKKEKDEYRKWIFIYIVALSILLAVFTFTAIWFAANWAGFNQFLNERERPFITMWWLIVVIVWFVGSTGWGLFGFIKTTLNSYKFKTFKDLSISHIRSILVNMVFGVIISIIVLGQRFLPDTWDNEPLLFVGFISIIIGTSINGIILFVLSKRVVFIRQIFAQAYFFEHNNDDPALKETTDKLMQLIRASIAQRKMMEQGQTPNHNRNIGNMDSNQVIVNKDNNEIVINKDSQLFQKLSNCSQEQLIDIAKKINLFGYEKMTKEELIKNIWRTLEDKQ